MTKIAIVQGLIFLLLLFAIAIALRLVKLPFGKTNSLTPRPFGFDSWFIKFRDSIEKIEEVKLYQSHYQIRVEGKNYFIPMKFGIDFFVSRPFPADGFLLLEAPDLMSDGLPVSTALVGNDREQNVLLQEQKRRDDVGRLVSNEEELNEAKSHELLSNETLDRKFMDSQIDRLKEVGLKKDVEFKKRRVAPIEEQVEGGGESA